jgi:nucleotidyltransferase/DNA polymerase involved in DNA repair
MIKEEIQRELGITVSIGLSLTKTLAKICSKHRKPDGFMPLPGRKIHILLKDTELKRVCGFGPNTVELLTKFGIKNVLEFVRRPVAFAEKLLGKPGRELWHELRGTQIYKISTEKKEKYLSISKSKTFSPPSKERDLVKAHLMRNLESAFIKLRRHGLSAKSLTIYLRLQDYGHDGLTASLDRHSASTLDFTELSSRLFDMTYREGVTYRATGVVLTDIVACGVDSRTLFDDPAKIESIANISKAVDKINQAYGKYTVHLASADMALTDKRDHPRKDLAWRKTALLKGESFRTRLNIPLLRLSPTPDTP